MRGQELRAMNLSNRNPQSNESVGHMGFLSEDRGKETFNLAEKTSIFGLFGDHLGRRWQDRDLQRLRKLIGDQRQSGHFLEVRSRWHLGISGAENERSVHFDVDL